MLASLIDNGKKAELDIKRDSERIFTLILNIRWKIGSIFLHENERKKMRVRQVVRTQEGIQTRLDTVNELINDYRKETEKLKKLVEWILEYIEISEWEIVDEIRQGNIRIKAEEIAKLQPWTDKREVDVVKHLLYAAWISKEWIDRYVRWTVDRNIAQHSIK
jgi:hypothetical protein